MYSLTTLIITTGYIGIFIAIFAESGFFLGFFLPGDSLLFTLGIFAAKGSFNIWTLIILGLVAAILGDSFGYWMGKRFGPRLFSRPNSFLFRREYVTRTENFYAKFGGKTIILARFVPIIRTFAPIMAGIGSMPYRIFLPYNIIGGSIWAAGILSIGFYLGTTFPAIQHYISYLIILIIVVSVTPILFELIKNYRSRRNQTRH